MQENHSNTKGLSEAKINAILAQIQSNIKAPKSATNAFGGFNYRTLSDILEAFKKASSGLNVTLRFYDEISSLDNHLLLTSTAILALEDEQIETCATVAVDFAHKKMSKEQIFGSASTYARKRAAEGLLLLDDCPDPDALSAQEGEALFAEAKTLDELIAATNTDVSKICANYDVSSIEELSSEQTAQVLSILNMKLKNKQ